MRGKHVERFGVVRALLESIKAQDAVPGSAVAELGAAAQDIRNDFQGISSIKEQKQGQSCGRCSPVEALGQEHSAFHSCSKRSLCLVMDTCSHFQGAEIAMK